MMEMLLGTSRKEDRKIIKLKIKIKSKD